MYLLIDLGRGRGGLFASVRFSRMHNLRDIAYGNIHGPYRKVCTQYVIAKNISSEFNSCKFV